MVKIDEKLCIGCSLCVKDCFPKNIKISNDKAEVIRPNCMLCGHCVSICPKNAVSIDEYDMDDVFEIEKTSITPTSFMSLVKQRRSIRHFTSDKVEKSILLKLIEVARYSPTAINMQGINYIVVSDKLQEFRKLVITSLQNKANEMLKNNDLPDMYKNYANMWLSISSNYFANPDAKDSVFLDAPTCLVITGGSEFDAGIASSNVELMANCYGLGVLHSGFIKNSCKDNDDIKAFLGLKPDENVISVILVGYPDIKYKRTAPRKYPNINWL